MGLSGTVHSDVHVVWYAIIAECLLATSRVVACHAASTLITGAGKDLTCRTTIACKGKEAAGLVAYDAEDRGEAGDWGRKSMTVS